MQLYACGFLFSPDRSRVLLIRKRRPAWQAGRLNGIGGKVEPGETAAQGMRREFIEEAGLALDSWEQVLTLTGPEWQAHFFRAIGDVDAAYAVTDEQLEIHPVASLPEKMIDNLSWIIPLMLDEEAGRDYRVVISKGT